MSNSKIKRKPLRLSNFSHSYFYHSKRKKTTHYPISPNPNPTPTYQQNNQLEALLKIIEQFRHKPKKLLLQYLANLGYTASDMRIYKSGGVGSYRWMPKYRRYRLQIAASHISRYVHYCPYALCIQF